MEILILLIIYLIAFFRIGKEKIFGEFYRKQHYQNIIRMTKKFNKHGTKYNG